MIATVESACVLVSDERGCHHSEVGWRLAYGNLRAKVNAAVRVFRQQAVKHQQALPNARQSGRFQLHGCVEMMQRSC